MVKISSSGKSDGINLMVKLFGKDMDYNLLFTVVIRLERHKMSTWTLFVKIWSQ